MKVSFWLVPAEPFRRDFSRLIARLAARFNAPVFTPHVTIFSGEVEIPEKAADIVKGAVSGASAIELRTNGVAFSLEFTKTLFVAFAEDAALARLADRIRRQCSPSAYELHPHLSLLYGSLPESSRPALAAEINPPGLVSFETIQAVATGESNRSRSDIEAWRLLAEARLSLAQS